MTYAKYNILKSICKYKIKSKYKIKKFKNQICGNNPGRSQKASGSPFGDPLAFLVAFFTHMISLLT